MTPDIEEETAADFPYAVRRAQHAEEGYGQTGSTYGSGFCARIVAAVAAEAVAALATR